MPCATGRKIALILSGGVALIVVALLGGPLLSGAPRSSATATPTPSSAPSTSVESLNWRITAVHVDVADALTIHSDALGLWLAVGGRPIPAPPDGQLIHIAADTLAVDRQFDVGWAPVDVVAFETSLWVVEAALDDQRGGIVKNAVDRFGPDGKKLASVPIAGPIAIASGFESVWVLSSADRSLGRIDPKPTELVGEITLPAEPHGIAITDGSVWVLAAPLADNGSVVYQIDPDSGRILRDIHLTDGGPGAIVGAGSSLWVVLSAVAPGASRLIQLDAETGQTTHQLDIPGNSALAIGSGELWLGSSDGRLQIVDLGTWTLDDVADIGTDISGLAADSKSIWILGNGQLQRGMPTS